jgi:undecaprenyl diphosphate synthase
MSLSSTLAVHKTPKHIAIIMDGNGRWAKKRLLPRAVGHYRGVKVVRKVIDACLRAKIEVLTIFAFSSENWLRPQEEVTALTKLFLSAFEDELEALHRANVQLCVIGDYAKFGDGVAEKIQIAQQLTAHNTGLKLVVAANYSGRWDIVEAARKLAVQVEQGKLTAGEITPEVFAACTSTHDIADPDLLIRTGGESRVSNFLLWQLAYSELYFTDVLWPDFDEKILQDALAFYASRERRFGKTSEQLEQ